MDKKKEELKCFNKYLKVSGYYKLLQEQKREIKKEKKEELKRAIDCSSKKAVPFINYVVKEKIAFFKKLENKVKKIKQKI